MTQFLTLATEAPAAGPFGNMNFMTLGLLFVGMWFLLIAPQRKKQKLQQQMLKALTTGDTVITSSGIYGVIANVKEDRFVLKVADNTKIEVAKAFVQAKIQEKTEAKK